MEDLCRVIPNPFLAHFVRKFRRRIDGFMKTAFAVRKDVSNLKFDGSMKRVFTDWLESRLLIPRADATPVLPVFLSTLKSMTPLKLTSTLPTFAPTPSVPAAQAGSTSIKQILRFV
jgi:hypothetical protein